MQDSIISKEKHFSIVYHFITPIIASLITYFLLWVLQDFLLINFIFSNTTMTITGFIVLTLAMMIISWYLPPNPQVNTDLSRKT